jgi:hypothetical protein
MTCTARTLKRIPLKTSLEQKLSVFRGVFQCLPDGKYYSADRLRDLVHIPSYA